MAFSFSPVAPQVRFPELEQRILDYWARHDIVARGLAQNEGKPEWVFYEGPPTANGRPGIHHVEARIFKDIFPRFQVMRGRYVHRKGGWDCHGLPVELQIEKELGFNRKAQIEEYGIEKFNAACRESVLRYVADWERLTERIGFWINMDEAYLTMKPSYVDSVWWSLKALYDAGLLFQDYKSVPYCPRCETALSDHELNYAGSYKTVVDPSVYVRFPLVDEGADLLVWTTTPWTLPSNLAAAVNPEVTYAKVAWGYERPVILAEELVPAVLNEGARIIETFPASRLVGRHYTPPFRYVEPDGDAWRVIDEEYVTTTDGTGVVHIAPAFGTEDLEAGRRHHLPFVNLVDRSGHFVAEAGPLAGMWVKDADRVVIDDLAARDLLFKEAPYEHNYPHCWRCGTPLLYYAKSSWFVRTTKFREGLLAQNEQTTWHPEAIKHGRYGDWLANNIDWALSRDRYWGTPLPIWECPEGHRTVAGSRADLSRLAGRDLTGLDPHRPFVDEVTFTCPTCGPDSGNEARRVPEVIDAWYDSGSMPFAQWGFPHDGVETMRRRFPADFICEGLDQTRGWFYSLMAVSTLVFGRSSYKQVLCLGLIVDEDGRKMSKSLGNVLDPWSVLDTQGADALRWYLFTSGSPWANRRLGPGVVEEFLRRYLLTLWNTYSFFVTYANLDGFDPGAARVPVAERPELDRWMLAELHDAVAEVTDALESYDALRGGRRLDALVDDLSNWYVRRSRRRFWRSEASADKAAAYATLWECLETIAQLTAPYTPFIAEEIYTNLTGSRDGASVHLTSWPAVEASAIDRDLMARMHLARQLVALGRAARAKAKVRTRQPLPRALAVVPAAERGGVATQLIAEELNVKELELVDSLEELVHYTIKPNFRALGPRFGKRMPVLAAAIAALSPGEQRTVRDELATGGRAQVTFDGEVVTLEASDVEVRAERREGYEVEHEGAYAVALDTEITPELRAEGLAREVVRAVQDARKEAGLEISDRIGLWLSAGGELGGAIDAHEAWILGEVLGVERLRARPEGFTKGGDVDGERLEIGLAKA